MEDENRSDGDDAVSSENGEAGRKTGTGIRDSLTSEAMPASVACPFCDGSETEQFSAFGSALSVSQYYCRDCRTVFEWMKWHDRD